MVNKNKTQTEADQAEVSTKQKILDVAIDLFAQNGFDAVSMQNIAQIVGIKKASLYYHYTSKDQILKEILQYPITRIQTVAPQGQTEALITSMGVEGFMTLSSGVFLNYMEDEKMHKVWRILCIELYHNEQIKQFFAIFKEMSSAFWESNFNFMLKSKLIKPIAPKVLVNEYLSFFMEAYFDYFLNLYGKTSNPFQVEYKEVFSQHTQFLINAIKPAPQEGFQ
jgi:TetR/AcrR family transcriptional regulator, biofilm operon repressor